MGAMFDERERAAEGIFVREGELRFLAQRRGFESLAAWASASMELDHDGERAYLRRLMDMFLTGAAENEILATVQTDLERAGKPALSTNAGTVLAQATADATLALRGRAPQSASPSESGSTSPMSGRPAQGWTWSL